MGPKESNRLTVTQSRLFSAHHILISAAEAALKDAESKRGTREPGWRCCVLTAITLSALSLESLFNLMGQNTFEDWKEDFESIPPRAKLRLLAIKLDLDYDKNKEPWINALWLLKFRNRIAHAKPEPLEEEKSITEQEYDRKMFCPPQSKLERDLTIRNAKRAIETFHLVREILWKKSPPGKGVGLYADMCVGSTSIQNPIR